MPPAFTRASLGPRTTSKGTIVSSSLTSASLRPMKRLMEKTVFSVGHCLTPGRRATRRSPPSVNATTDGVVRAPSAPRSRWARRPRGSPCRSWSCQDRFRWSCPSRQLLLLAFRVGGRKSKREYGRSKRHRRPTAPIEAVFAAFGERDPDAIVARFHPDGELVLDGGLAMLTGTRHAKQGIRAWFAEWFALTNGSEARLERHALVGDRLLVLATALAFGVDRGAGETRSRRSARSGMG